MRANLLHSQRLTALILASLAGITTAGFIILLLWYVQSPFLLAGLLAGIVIVLSLIAAMGVIPQKVMLLILIGFPLLGRLIDNIAFLHITVPTGIPAGGLFDLFVVTVLFGWVLKKTIRKPAVSIVEKPIFPTFLDGFMILFLGVILLNYIRGIALGNIAIFSEGRGFLYYLLFFPMVDALKIDRLNISKINKTVFYAAIAFLLLFILDIQGLFLPVTVAFIEGIMEFGLIGGDLIRTALVDTALSIILFTLSLFLFLASSTKKGRRMALLALLISLFINLRSFTRGFQVGLLAALTMSIVMMGRTYRHQLFRYARYFLIPLLVGGVMASYFYMGEVQVFIDRWRETVAADPSIVRRGVEAEVFFTQFLERPVLGNNIGTTQTFLVPDWAGRLVEVTIAGPHTEIIYWLYTLGILGTGLFLVILLLVFKMGFSNIKNIQLPQEHKLLQKAVLVTIVALGIVSFSSWQFRSWHVVPIIVTMFAYTRNLYLYSSFLRSGKSVVRVTND